MHIFVSLCGIFWLLAVATSSVTQDGSKGCLSASYCESDECCLSQFQLKGKRQLILPSMWGTCTKMGVENSPCFVSGSKERGHYHVMRCPCGTGYACKGTGVFEVPMGETGVCEKV
ncbi:uncharacterized protein LOC106157733 [Lingula anatina]|uniref:Uncharacterized protein LOC106157733 n=1 Tax=Lingula anatina TaxID=7574 RepID=A0A1S3HV40_LINAN|nr:uncharacterized protein LOC106157733 [Lingula anatina]|eukprot:XP_013388924.1 uncharacterized protein LOC106157733 [Lingula anatina]